MDSPGLCPRPAVRGCGGAGAAPGLLSGAQRRPPRLFCTCSFSRPGIQGPREQVQGWGQVTSFPSGPRGGPAVGTGREGGRPACGAAGAMWYSHYQPAAQAGPAAPLATVAAFTPPRCLLTQGCLPQGTRCHLGNEGVQGPPKQPAAGPLGIPGAHFWGVGGRAAGPRSGGPWGKADSESPDGEGGHPESACPDTVSPRPRCWCVTLGTAREAQ